MAIRTNHRVLRLVALLCVAALLCPGSTVAGPAIPSAAAASDFPVASDVRLAGDAKQTRFILDLDKTIQFRAFTLADPYRVVVDLPQVDFRLPNGSGTNGRGLVKAFRYGLVMPGGSRIVFDLTGPARISSSYVLDAANGQAPRLVLEFEEVDRAGFAQSMAADSRPELRPAIADAAGSAAREPTAPAAAGPAAPADPRPVIVIDPG
ncbi:MAG: AMIN domain-containing protein, partial [Bradyrhizobium sp.]